MLECFEFFFFFKSNFKLLTRTSSHIRQTWIIYTFTKLQKKNSFFSDESCCLMINKFSNNNEFSFPAQSVARYGSWILYTCQIEWNVKFHYRICEIQNIFATCEWINNCNVLCDSQEFQNHSMPTKQFIFHNLI